MATPSWPDWVGWAGNSWPLWIGGSAEANPLLSRYGDSRPVKWNGLSIWGSLPALGFSITGLSRIGEKQHLLTQVPVRGRSWLRGGAVGAVEKWGGYSSRAGTRVGRPASLLLSRSACESIAGTHLHNVIPGTPNTDTGTHTSNPNTYVLSRYQHGVCAHS